VSILRFLSVFLMNRLQEQMQGKLSDWILIWWVCWIIVILFFLVLLDATFKDTELTYYNLSENWKEFLAKIYWYKYFLEACDEKKIKTFLDQDPEYLDKIMPYAIALWVETEIIENIAPNILDWINNNRYTWDLSCTTKTVITSSERTILFPTEKNEIHKGNKSTKTTKETKIKRQGDSYLSKTEIKF
jgi:hypothetical protein